MSRNALDIAKQALALWRGNYGNESLDQQCQRFDGYYWQWAYQGNENIRTYGTATAAARASEMFTHDINDASISPGDLVYWDWGTDGHVGTVIGRQNGRTLVTHTSSRGDTVLSLTNNVKVSHADSIPLTFIGVSHTNGSNARRTGLTAWPAAEFRPHERQVTAGGPANRRAEPTTKSATVGEGIPGGDTGEFDGWIRGESVSGNNVWFRGLFSGDWFWSGSLTDPSTKGLKDLNSAPAPTPDPNPTPDPDPEPAYTPALVTPTAQDFPAWIRYEEVIDPDATEQTNKEDYKHYGRAYDPIESHAHWWDDPEKNPTHDGVVDYLKRTNNLSANYVTSEGRVTLMVPLNRLAYTTGSRNPYGWKTENDPALTDGGYLVMGFLHYLVEKLNPKLSGEQIRLHSEFTSTSCSKIDVARVRDIATRFKTGALDPSTGKPTSDPVEPEPTPGGLAELIQLAITFLKRILGIK